MREPGSPVSQEGPDGTMDHLDEMTCLLYAERQLDRVRAQAVSAHAQDCASCRTLLRALDRESTSDECSAAQPRSESVSP